MCRTRICLHACLLSETAARSQQMSSGFAGATSRWLAYDVRDGAPDDNSEQEAGSWRDTQVEWSEERLSACEWSGWSWSENATAVAPLPAAIAESQLPQRTLRVGRNGAAEVRALTQLQRSSMRMECSELCRQTDS